MKISTRGRYALRMMLDLAENQGSGVVALKDIAARQGISKKYLEQIIPVLNRAGLLQTSRGFQGEILRAAEGGLSPVACLEQSPNACPRCHECETLPIWAGLEQVVNEYLDGISLQDVLDGPNKPTKE